VRLRPIAVALGLAFIAFAFAATLTVATREAEAGCSTTSVCSWHHGRQVCSSSTSCYTPRIRTCSWVDRCAPQRSCYSSYGRTTCVTRNVCRREQVCY
jgi:hypothetical protein